MDRRLSRKPAVIIALIAIVLAGIVSVVLFAGADGDKPDPMPTTAATTPKPTLSVASSHLDFQRNDDGGFTADFVIHANGQLEVRQIGVGYPNWEYLVGPRVSIRMTDDEGRLHFAPKLTCPDPDRQAPMPEVANPLIDSIESGRFDAVLSVEQDGERVRVQLELTGNAPDRRDDRYVMVWGGEACDARTDDPTIGPDLEARLREMLPDTLEVGSDSYFFEWTISSGANPSADQLAPFFPGISPDELANVGLAAGFDASARAGGTNVSVFIVSGGSSLTGADLAVAADRAISALPECVEGDQATGTYFDCNDGWLTIAYAVGEDIFVQVIQPGSSVVAAQVAEALVGQIEAAN